MEDWRPIRRMMTMLTDSPLILPRAILFDMDGTLAELALDFTRIKREMGIGDRPILEGLAELNEQQRPAAQAVLERHEDIAAQSCALNPGCREMLDWIAQRRIPLALITRNSRRSAALVVRRHELAIDVLITREDCPFKPNPAPLVLACQRLGIPTSDAWMVGDGQYDVEAGRAAGIPVVWLSHGRPKSFAAEPWKTVPNLHQLVELLKTCV
jgi:HAD superfamily hydrolase (TIGR01549 family)